jgi:hypothetical protein
MTTPRVITNMLTQYPIRLIRVGDHQSTTYGKFETEPQSSETLTFFPTPIETEKEPIIQATGRRSSRAARPHGPHSVASWESLTMKRAARPVPEPDTAAAQERRALTKATIRAAQKLGLSNRMLSAVIGLSPPTITLMNTGRYELNRSSKAFDLSVLFVRLYRSLDAIVSGDERVAREWLNNRNVPLGDKPINLIQNVSGLVNVIQYLDARRARV